MLRACGGGRRSLGGISNSQLLGIHALTPSCRVPAVNRPAMRGDSPSVLAGLFLLSCISTKTALPVLWDSATHTSGGGANHCQESVRQSSGPARSFLWPIQG